MSNSEIKEPLDELAKYIETNLGDSLLSIEWEKD